MAINTAESSDQRVPVLERALTMLEHLLQHPKGLGISDMVNQLGFPKNSVYRILNTLEGFGYVLRDGETKRYILSRKMFSMAYSSPDDKGLMENALEVMRDLRDEVKETILLSILSDDEGLVLEQIPGTYSFRFVVDPGTRRSIHASSHGKAILAFLPDREQDALIQRLRLTRFTDNTITTREELRSELHRIRDRGYALDLAEEGEGVHCVSAPILNQQGVAVAALTTTGPSFRMHRADLDDIGKIVKNYADRVSARLGYGLV